MDVVCLGDHLTELALVNLLLGLLLDLLNGLLDNLCKSVVGGTYAFSLLLERQVEVHVQDAHGLAEHSRRLQEVVAV